SPRLYTSLLVDCRSGPWIPQMCPPQKLDLGFQNLSDDLEDESHRTPDNVPLKQTFAVAEFADCKFPQELCLFFLTLYPLRRYRHQHETLRRYHHYEGSEHSNHVNLNVVLSLFLLHRMNINFQRRHDRKRNKFYP